LISIGISKPWLREELGAGARLSDVRRGRSRVSRQPAYRISDAPI
jgi:hypothetical protein